MRYLFFEHSLGNTFFKSRNKFVVNAIIIPVNVCCALCSSQTKKTGIKPMRKKKGNRYARRNQRWTIKTGLDCLTERSEIKKKGLWL